MSTLIKKESAMLAKKNTPSKSQGFSLVELLVILAIIAILGGMSGLALMKWIPQANLKRAARTIVSMCQEARVEAIKRNQATRIECSAGSNSCLVRLADGSATLRRFNLAELRGAVTITEEHSTNFNSRGRAASPGSIKIKNNADKSLTVTVRSSGSIVTGN